MNRDVLWRAWGPVGKTGRIYFVGIRRNPKLARQALGTIFNHSNPDAGWKVARSQGWRIRKLTVAFTPENR